MLGVQLQSYLFLGHQNIVDINLSLHKTFNSDFLKLSKIDDLLFKDVLPSND